MSERPLVALDVDGVSNLGLFASSKFRARMMNREREHWHNGWAYGDSRYGTRIFLDRRVGPMIQAIAEAGADLVWATRWEEAANDCIAPLLGLPELPVIPVNFTENGELVLKARAVTQYAAGRPWAWIDDEEDELVLAAELTAGSPHPFLPVCTNPKQGLTQYDADRVTSWVKGLS